MIKGGFLHRNRAPECKFPFRATQLSAAGPSKYHYAAHMGQLIRGFEGGGCHHFFPACPFSAHDVRQIARKVAVADGLR